MVTSLAQQASQQQMQDIAVHYENKKFEEVIKLLRPLFQQYNLNENAYLIKSSSHLQLGNIQKARNWIDKGISQFPQSLDMRLFEVETEQRNVPRAINMMTMIINDKKAGVLESDRVSLSDIYDGKAWLHLLAGRDKLQQLNYEAAIKHFEAATNYSEGNIDVHRNLLYTYLKAEKFSDLIDAFEKLPEKFKQDHQLTTLRSQALIELEQFDEVIDLYRNRYKQNPDDLDSAKIYGQLLLESNQPAEANELFIDLLEAHPDERNIYDFLLELNYRQRNYSGVVNLLQQMITQFPNDKELPFELAEAYQMGGNSNKAIAVFDSLKQTRGNVYDVVYPKSVLLFQDGKKEQAYLELKQVEDRYEVLEIEKNLGKITLLINQFESAVKHFSEYLKTNPGDSLTLILKARSLKKTGQEYGAGEIYKEALNAGANWPEAYHYIFKNEQKTSEHIDEWFNAFSYSIENIQAREEVFAFQAQLAMQKALITQENSFYPANAQLIDLNTSLWDLYELGIKLLERSMLENLLLNLKEEHPDFEILYEMTGNFYEEIDENRALSVYKNGLDINSNNKSVLMAIAEIKEKRGNIDNSILWYERANSVDSCPKVYRSLIRLNRKIGALDQLIDRWLIRHHSGSATDPLLKEYLIDALHRAGRSKEAREIAAN